VEERSRTVARISVIGIGNVLEGDDAFGPTVVHLFEAAWTVPEDVALVDGGTPGLDLTAYMAELEALIMIDSMKLKGGAAGEMKVLDKPGILNRGPIVAMSPHEPGLREAILHAEFQGVAPPVVKLIGVVAGSIDFGCRLSPEVRAALPAAVAQVKAELEALGVAVAPRLPPADPGLWWEKPQHG
jgi:hydrogenase maturation protease